MAFSNGIKRSRFITKIHFVHQITQKLIRINFYNKMTISEKITQLRESKKIKQSEVARALEIDQPNYSRLEKRGEKLTIEQLNNIAEILGVSITYFFTDTTISPNNQPLINTLKKEIEELRIDNRILLRQLDKK